MVWVLDPVCTKLWENKDNVFVRGKKAGEGKLGVLKSDVTN